MKEKAENFELLEKLLKIESYQHQKEMIKIYENEMHRHYNEGTAWSEELYDEEERKLNNILEDADYKVIVFENL